MDLFLFLFFLYLIHLYVLMFDKKLLVLLYLEGIMIINILFFSLSYFNTNPSFFCFLMFSLFMVLDSVFGISILISSTRNSSTFSLSFSSF